jgi:Flp pilus assembly protein TadD
MARGMKGIDAAASVLFALSLVGLTGCGEIPWDPDRWGLDRLDPFATNGRDGGGIPLSYDTLMRLGAAARASGDVPNAVSLYRRAASINGASPAPFVAIGNSLLDMGSVDEAIVAFNSALERTPRDPEALRGLARAYLRTGRPELAGQPLGVAFEDTPNDPKLLQLIGVADDYLDQHGEAQARYHRGLELAPADPGLTVNLALSLALTGDYDQAIARLRPIAAAPSSTPRERQTLALIYGLKGDRRAAEQLGRLDLEPSVVQHNLAYYDNLRRLSPEARSRAIRALGTNPGASRPS